MKKYITPAVWKQVKACVTSGMSVKDIEHKFGGEPSASQIYARKKKWEKLSYFAGKEKYAKYQTPEYKKWRTAVLLRDGHKCIICKRGRPEVKALQADHILSYSQYPDKRFDVSNGRTLCVYHHKRTLNYGRKALFCNDEENGKKWELRERILWQKKQQEKQAKRTIGKVTKVKERVSAIRQKLSSSSSSKK